MKRYNGCHFHNEAGAGEILVEAKGFVNAFVDLEKAFDRVPREVLWWALRYVQVHEWIGKCH
jgi:hypothetical protein